MPPKRDARGRFIRQSVAQRARQQKSAGRQRKKNMTMSITGPTNPTPSKSLLGANDLRIQGRVNDAGLQKAMASIGPHIARELKQVVSRNAMILRNLIKIKIQRGPKSGRLYTWEVTTIKGEPSIGTVKFPNGKILRVKKRNKPHRASAPYEPPATDKGFLASSVQYTLGGLEAEVGYVAKYGPFLEFGTRFMKPRPAIKPALEERRPAFIEDVRRVVVNALAANKGRGKASA